MITLHRSKHFFNFIKFLMIILGEHLQFVVKNIKYALTDVSKLFEQIKSLNVF